MSPPDENVDAFCTEWREWVGKAKGVDFDKILALGDQPGDALKRPLCEEGRIILSQHMIIGQQKVELIRRRPRHWGEREYLVMRRIRIGKPEVALQFAATNLPREVYDSGGRHRT